MRSVGVKCSLVVLLIACLGGTTSAPVQGASRRESSPAAVVKPAPVAKVEVPSDPDARSKSSGITSSGATETLKLMLLFFGGRGESGDAGATVLSTSE